MDLSASNFSTEEEKEVVQKQFREAFLILQQEAIVDDDPVMCQLHDAFGTYETSHHNCLGCNFADSTWLIHNFLRTHQLQEEIKHAYSTLIILAYLLVERTDTFFDIIELNKTYRDQHFKVLLEIRRWANFLKHPKAFLLTHHPVFTFCGSPKNRDLRENASVVIDRAFVDKYYANDKKNKELYKKLENTENVLVVFPDALRLVRDLCEAMHRCVAVVRDNPVYRSTVEGRTTFYDYWLDLEAPIEQ
jgi:hypothetical protein